MKKIIFILFSILFGLSLNAQPINPNPNNFYVFGSVSNKIDNKGIPNHDVILLSYDGSILKYTKTNIFGVFSFEVVDGSLDGVNIIYLISTKDCNNSIVRDTVSNYNGKIDVEKVNLKICSNDQIELECDPVFVSKHSVTVQNEITFYGNPKQTIGKGYKNLWQFGDNSQTVNAEGINVVHTYKTPGTYNVCHKVINIENNCQKTFCKKITVLPQEKDTTQFKVGGIVLAGNNPMDYARVFLIRFDPISKSFILASTTTLDASGKYMFDNIKKGSYLIRVVPLFESQYFKVCIPTYYGNKFCWKLAKPIVVTEDITSCDISMIFSPCKKGPGKCGGGVKGPHRFDETFLSDSYVVLTDINDIPKYWVNVDSSGNFQFDGLEYGTYKVYFNYDGLNHQPLEITISQEKPQVDIVIQLEENLIDFIEDNNIINGKISIYPNPSVGILNVNFILEKQSDIVFEVMNFSGQIVFSEIHNNLYGNLNIVTNLNNMSNGIYMFNIRDIKSQQILNSNKIIIQK